ncbi:MAG: PQQ-binding-like beta-propeller repeat protein [Pseudomonadales bacterium]|nr:PQQ-binding-like beta-propeller repeat protein [Pseudomonadales bacterium]
MTASDDVYLGIGGHVVRVRTSDGVEIWRNKLKRSRLTTVVVDGDVVYAGASGVLYALDAETGSVLWENQLKGLGKDSMLIATEESQ